jgi:hypothetical protein
VILSSRSISSAPSAFVAELAAVVGFCNARAKRSFPFVPFISNGFLFVEDYASAWWSPRARPTKLKVV